MREIEGITLFGRKLYIEGDDVYAAQAGKKILLQAIKSMNTPHIDSRLMPKKRMI